MSVDRLISILSLVVTTLLTCFVGYLTYLTLRFTTKPRLRISLRHLDEQRVYKAGEVAKLRFYIENIGYWYGQPAATNVRLYVNFEPAFEPIGLGFGSQMEIAEENVRRGKGGSKFLRAKGIHLFSSEPGEEVEATVRMPSEAGRYRCWLSAFSDQGDCGVHEFDISVARLSGETAESSKSVPQSA